MKSVCVTWSLGALAVVSLALGCGDSNPAAPDVRQVSLHVEGSTAKTINMVLGDTVKVFADVRDGAGQLLAGVPIAFRSTNPAIAHVGSAGKVTGQTIGSCYITAIAQGRSGSVRDSVLTTIAILVGSDR